MVVSDSVFKDRCVQVISAVPIHFPASHPVLSGPATLAKFDSASRTFLLRLRIPNSRRGLVFRRFLAASAASREAECTQQLRHVKHFSEGFAEPYANRRKGPETPAKPAVQGA